MNTVLVTGAAGFAGSHLVDLLLQGENRVIALDIPGCSLANLDLALDRVVVELADLNDVPHMRRVLERHLPDRIYHLAATSTKLETAGAFWLPFETIAKGTLNLLHACRETGIKARMLYVSSAEVYGCKTGDLMPVREDHSFAPNSLYAASKIAAEMFCLHFFVSYGIPIVRVRPFQHTGPRQQATFVCSNFARQFAEIARKIRTPRIHAGNLHVRRDFTDVRDVVRAYVLALEKGVPGEVYQVCSGSTVSIQSLLDILRKITSLDVKIELDQSKVRPDEVEAYWGDSTKLAAVTGWRPSIPIDSTLRDLVDHWSAALTERATAAGHT